MVPVLLLILLPAIALAANPTPDSCFSQTNFDSFVTCLSTFIARPATYSDEEYRAALITTQQIADWKSVIGQILSSDANCDKLQVPQSISANYAIKLFTDKPTSAQFCVLYEKTTKPTAKGTRFEKGWAFFVTPYTHSWTRYNLHYSAAHPRFDGPVHIQAANVFFLTNGRSLTITGVERHASNVSSECQPKNSRTDGAHDTGTGFHHAMIATHEWQFEPTEARNCLTSNCAWIQFHGKASTACPKSTIFLSTGYGSVAPIYSDDLAPVNRIKTAWRQLAPSNWTAHIPTDNTCDLNGGSNIFSRLVNKVPQGQECETSPKLEDATGLFIHIEQASDAREPGAYNIYAKTFMKAYRPRK